MRKFQNFHLAARPQHFKTLVLYTFPKEAVFDPSLLRLDLR